MSARKMTVSLDGGSTWVDAESVRVLVNLEPPEDADPDTDAHLLYNFSGEGLVTDAWVNNVCEGTTSATYYEVGDSLVGF